VHIHIGALDAVKAFLSVIIIGFFWRLIAGHLSDSPIGQAMAFVY
jgi:hypothetical protein